jgi:hypothetical protein
MGPNPPEEFSRPAANPLRSLRVGKFTTRTSQAKPKSMVQRPTLEPCEREVTHAASHPTLI